MRKVLYVVTREFYPMLGGREVVLFNYCKGLYEKYDCSIDLFCFSDSAEGIKVQKDLNFINQVYQARRPTFIPKCKNLIWKSLLLRKWPVQVSLYYSTKTQKELNTIIKQNNYDIVICDMARTAEYLRNIKGVRKVLDMNDLISNRYFRQAAAITTDSNILGQFASKIPEFVVKVLNNQKVAQLTLKLEATLLKRYELEIESYFDDIIFVSSLETIQYDELIKKNKSVTIPIGVDYDYYSKQMVEKNSQPLISFLGNMQIPHNRDAVDYFIKEIHPSILKRVPNYRLRVVGKCDECYKEEMMKYSFIEVTGTVDDIRPYVQESLVSIAPLLYGSGVKTKVLETLAMGVPMVTNMIGAEGIDAEENDGLFICESPEEFAQAVITLLENQCLRSQLSENACELIKNKYTWDSVLKHFNRIIEK